MAFNARPDAGRPTSSTAGDRRPWPAA